jgi:hypothetical protein
MYTRGAEQVDIIHAVSYHRVRNNVRYTRGTEQIG